MNSMSNEHFVGNVYKWNWVSFFFTPVWAIANKVWFALVVFMILVYLVPPLVFIFSIFMGIYGNRLAYDRFDGDEIAFYQRKQKWVRAIIISLLINALFAVPGYLNVLKERSLVAEAIEMMNNDLVLTEEFESEDFESLINSWTKTKLSSKLSIFHFTIIDDNNYYLATVDIRDGIITELSISEFGDEPDSFEYKIPLN